MHSLKSEAGGPVSTRAGGALGGAERGVQGGRGPTRPSGEARDGARGVRGARGVLVLPRGVKQRNSMPGMKKTTKRTRGASRVAGGGVLRLWQGAGPTRTTQGRRVGGLRPKVHSIGVAGEFGDVVESAENARRGRRAGLTAPPRAHHAMASARRARRRRGRPARRPRRRGCKCTYSRRGKFLTKGPRSRRDRRAVAVTLAAHYKPF